MELDRIYLDDCMHFMSTMSSASVQLVLTDIPYNEVNKSSQGLRKIDKGIANTLTFDLLNFLNEIKRIVIGSIYVFCGIEQVSFIFKELNNGFSARHCVWEKTNPSPMNGQHLWLSAIENCVFAKHPGSTFTEFCKSNVWRFPTGSSNIHPTAKPISLFKYLICSSSREGDIVFDPCMGSGTTALACIASGRHFIGVERHEEWHALCEKRVKQAIGKDMFCLQRTQT